MGNKNKLSVCMMVKNEEDYLEDCLRSLEPLGNNFKTEIIVVDTGSEDKTVEIAKKYADKVFFHKWTGDFGEMRNKTIESATGEWILILDGDEVFKNIEPLIEFLKSPISKDYNSITIDIKNVNAKDGEGKASSKGTLLRGFRNTKYFKYTGRIHEQPEFENPVFFSSAEIIHYGYDSSDAELMEDKYDRNLELIKKELEEDPENIYMLFQLSQTYGMYKKNKKALEVIVEAYKIIKKNKINPGLYLNVYNQLVKMYAFFGKNKEVIDIGEEAVQIEKNFHDFYYFIGIAQLNLGRDTEALKNFKRYLNILEKNKKSGKDLVLIDHTSHLYENIYINIASIYRDKEEYKKSLDYLNKVTKPELEEVKVRNLVDIYIKMRDYNDLMSYYKEISSKGDKDLINSLWGSVEKAINEESLEGKINIMELLVEGNDTYSMLNRVRLDLLNEPFIENEDLVKWILGLDFSELGLFFGDLIYYLILVGNLNIGEILSNLLGSRLNSFIKYIVSQEYEGFPESAFDYIKNTSNNTLPNIRFTKELTKELLINHLVKYYNYEEVFDYYLASGTRYLKEIYNENIISEENIYNLKDSEEMFIVYMIKANENKEDKGLYARYLRKALKVYPNMKDLIEILTEELKEEINNPDQATKEFDAIKVEFKKNIDILYEEGKLMEAKLVIDEYLKLRPEDLEILAIKSTILTDL